MRDQLNILFDYAHVKTYDLLAVLFGNKHTIKIVRIYILYDMQVRLTCNHFRFVWGLEKNTPSIFAFHFFKRSFCLLLSTFSASFSWNYFCIRNDLNGPLWDLIDLYQTFRLFSYNKFVVLEKFISIIGFSHIPNSDHRFFIFSKKKSLWLHFHFIWLVFSFLSFPCLFPNVFFDGVRVLDLQRPKWRSCIHIRYRK